ncbi:MAG: type II toxin-antitoxin system RelB/DinJ family antitoxin [Clostridia bacterium]|nr:type II toxin-antitoxin system RelB/DinJ family antitoxin [Clostridia bacterium]
MAQTNINIRMDEDLKKQFENFCSEVGMSMTTAFCIFAKTVVRQHRIPFEVSTESDPFYSAANMERLRRSAAQMERTGGTVHEIGEIEDDD